MNIFVIMKIIILIVTVTTIKVTLVDPIPDVRATAAKAFGTLANGLPEEMLGDQGLQSMRRSPF